MSKYFRQGFWKINETPLKKNTVEVAKIKYEYSSYKFEIFDWPINISYIIWLW